MFAILSMFMAMAIRLTIFMLMIMLKLILVTLVVIFHAFFSIVKLIQTNISKLWIRIFSYLIMTVNFLFPFWIFYVAMLKTYLFQAILIITNQLIAKRCCTVTWIRVIVMRLMVMITRLWHQTMGMTSRMKYKIHNDVDSKTSHSHN